MPRYYYVVGTSYHWLASYLHGRSQQVCYHSVLFDSGDVTVDVPQGSMLGPFLLLVYVNDFPHGAMVSSRA